MLELTTGVIFLVSSFYGSGQNSGQINPIATTTETRQATTTKIIEVRSFSTSTDMESYLRVEYANTPVLVDIARCESQFRQYNKDGSVLRGRAVQEDIGVMQINEYYHGSTARKMGIDIKTVEGNVAFAKYLYTKYGSSPWSASQPCWSKVKTGDLARK